MRSGRGEGAAHGASNAGTYRARGGEPRARGGGRRSGSEGQMPRARARGPCHGGEGPEAGRTQAKQARGQRTASREDLRREPGRGCQRRDQGGRGSSATQTRGGTGGAQSRGKSHKMGGRAGGPVRAAGSERARWGQRASLLAAPGSSKDHPHVAHPLGGHDATDKTDKTVPPPPGRT